MIGIVHVVELVANFNHAENHTYRILINTLFGGIALYDNGFDEFDPVAKSIFRNMNALQLGVNQ